MMLRLSEGALTFRCIARGNAGHNESTDPNAFRIWVASLHWAAASSSSALPVRSSSSKRVSPATLSTCSLPLWRTL